MAGSDATVRVLPSGMRFAFRKSLSPVAYCAVHVQTGTRYEDPSFGGLSHFTEHLIFKGTEHKRADVINSYIEKLGGELNAYTTKEETVIHSTVLKEDLSKAISLLVELAFRCVFPEKEIDKERSVVLEEIKSYEDSPSEQIFDDFEELLFEGTPLSMPVLGKVATLKHIGRDTVVNNYHDMFVPENMVFTVVADLEEKKVLDLLSKAMLKYGPLPEERKSLSDRKTPASLPQLRRFDKSVSRRNHQVHCILGSEAYSLYDPRRVPLIVLTNMVGGPAANSRLNLLLREKYAMVYSVDCSYTQYMDTGSMMIYFGCDRSNLSRCEKMIAKVLSEVMEQPLSEKALKETKKQLLGQLAISSDSGEAQVLSMGKSIQSFGRVMENEETRAMVEAVTSEQIREAAADVFDPEKMSRLVYL